MSADTKVSVPIQLLFEGIDHTITVELKKGGSYRGLLTDAEECMNLHMSNVTYTAKDGQKIA